MIIATLLRGPATPAYADSSAYELYCPKTPVGNIALNGVTTTGTIAPLSPGAGQQFTLTDYSSTVTLPAAIVAAAAALGNTVIDGTALTKVDATGATPAAISSGTIAIDVPIPSPVPSRGLTLSLPATPGTVGPFTATGGAITLTVDPVISMQLIVSGSNLDLQCTPYPNNAAATGIIASKPPGSPASPVIATASTGTTTSSGGPPTTSTTSEAPTTTTTLSTMPTTTPTAPPPSPTTSVPSTSGPGPYYLALGDSVPVWNGPDSYPYQIASHYGPAIPGLTVVDMACSGETTSSMIANSFCPSGPTGSQLQEAVGFLQAHQGSVAFITIDIGGNDVVNCANGAGIDVGCVLSGLTTMQTNMDSILSDIRQAAGPTVPIYGMNYFNPFLGDWVAGGAGQSFAVASVPELTLFNQVVDGVYGGQDIPVADVATAFSETDLTDLVSSRWGQVPVAVDKACTLLDITCTVGQLEGFGDDPVTAGATVIAGAFEQTMGAMPTTIPTATTTTTTTTTTPTTTTTGPTATSTSTTGAGSPTTTSTAPPGTRGQSATSTTANRVVTAPSRSLAFTGVGGGTGVVGILGVGLVLVGMCLLALVDGPRRAVAGLRALAASARDRSSAPDGAHSPDGRP